MEPLNKGDIIPYDQGIVIIINGVPAHMYDNYAHGIGIFCAGGNDNTIVVCDLFYSHEASRWLVGEVESCETLAEADDKMQTRWINTEANRMFAMAGLE